MSNQDREKRTFHAYLQSIFESPPSNLIISTCNTGGDGIDFKVAPPDNQGSRESNDPFFLSNDGAFPSSGNISSRPQRRSFQQANDSFLNNDPPLFTQNTSSDQQGLEDENQGQQDQSQTVLAFRKLCQQALSRQAPKQEGTFLKPGQFGFDRLYTYLDKFLERDKQNQPPEIVNMIDLMGQTTDIDFYMLDFFPGPKDRKRAEDARTRLEKDITVNLNNFLNKLEEDQRKSVINSVKKFHINIKKQPVSTTTSGSTISTLMLPPPTSRDPQTSKDRRRRKLTNSDSSSHGQDDDSLSSSDSSSTTTHGLSSLVKQTSTIADILSKNILPDMTDEEYEQQMLKLGADLGTSSSSVVPVSSSKTTGKKTHIETEKGGLKTGKKTSSTASTSSSMSDLFSAKGNSSKIPTSSTTSNALNNRKNKRNTSDKPYIELTKIDVHSMKNLITYLRSKPKRGVLTDHLVEKVIPNFVESITQASGINRSSTSKRTERQKKILASFSYWKQQLVNTLGQYINTLLNEKRQMTNKETTANEIRNIIYKSQFKPQAK